MPNVPVGIESLVISSPGQVAEIAISVDKGAQGARGAKLFANSGHPTQLTYKIGNNYYLYNNSDYQLAKDDMYWRIDTARAYQFIVALGGGLEWIELGGSTVGELTSTVIDFVGSSYQTYELTADSGSTTTFTTDHIQKGYTIELLITNLSGISKDVAFPAWTWVTPIPKTLENNQRFLLTLRAFGETNSDIVASASTSVYLEAVV